MRDLCPHCGLQLVQPDGPAKAPILIASEHPGYREILTGRPFADRAGDVLRKVLIAEGLSYLACRVTNLWLHAVPERGRTKVSRALYVTEYEWHLARLLEEMEGRQAVLLLGSEACEAVIGLPVMDVAGLKWKPRPLLPKQVRLLMAAPNPAQVYQKKQTSGEFTLAISKFATQWKRMEKRNGKRNV